MNILTPAFYAPCALRNAFLRLTAFRFALLRLLLLAILTGVSFQVRSQTTTLNLAVGWNLVGNSGAAPIDVATTLGDATTITTAWTWNRAAGKWAFYAPSMTPSALTAYAQGKGYDVLTSVAPKEGFWVNASTAVSLTVPAASAVTLAESDLQQGWNLVGSADNKTPSQLNQGLDSSLNAAGKAIVTAWAWDAPIANWKFYAPSLEAQGGTVLADYITGKGYLAFSTALSVADGFWMNVGAVAPGATENSLAIDMRSAFGADNVNAVSRALGLAGIVVYSDDVLQANGTTVVSPGRRMLKAQARGLAMELSAGAGFTGALLNTLTPALPLEDGTLVPVSQLLAAYIAYGDTYGARQSRALMPGIDPAKHLGTQFPTITIVFFMKEFVVPLLAAAQDPAAVNMALVGGSFLRASAVSSSAVSDPCAAVSGFLDGLAPSVESAIQDLLDPGRSSAFLSFVTSVVGSIVQITTAGVKSLLRHAPSAAALREIANILGALTDMKSLFSQWTVNITPPGPLHKVPGSPNAGAFTLTMSNGGDGFEWPQAVTSCADLFGISLPQLDSADGSTVRWAKVSGFDDLGISTGPEVGVIAANQTSYSVASATESADLHNGGGFLDHGALAVRADVQMPGIEQLATRIGSLIGSLGTGAAQTATNLAPHIGPSAPGVARVEFHTRATARINFDNGAYRLTASSPDGISPNGAWTGTFALNRAIWTQVDDWVEQPVSWTFANGAATLAVSFGPPCGPDIEACSFNSTEALTLQSSGQAQGPIVMTSGTWNFMHDFGWPGIDNPDDDPPYEYPPVSNSVPIPNLVYVIELVGAAP